LCNRDKWIYEVKPTNYFYDNIQMFNVRMMDSETLSCNKFVLPFVVEDINRKGKSFTFDMETAAIVCLAETQRKKQGLLGGLSEEFSFVSKIHYPLWAVPWGDKCLIVDGLGFSSYDDEYLEPPNVKIFVEDLKRDSFVREEFRNALKKHAESFKDFVATVDFSLNAVVAKKSLLHDLLEYFKEGTPLNENGSVMVPIVLKRGDALETCEKFIQYWRKIQADIKGFQYALNILNEETKLNKQGTISEIEQLREKYANEISRLKSDIEKKVKKLTKKQEAEIAKMTKAAEKKMKAAAKEKEKYERKLQILERNMVLLQKKVEASKRKKGESKVARWSYELKMCQREIDNINREIRAVSLLIERTRKEGKDAVRELEKRHQKMVEQEEAKITDLMALQNSDITGKQRELEELLLESSHIKNLIKRLIEQKKMHASKFKEETAISWKLDEITLVCLPFYLVRYVREAEARYRVYSPTAATDYKGILKSVQKAIRSFDLESRINLLLRLRSKELSDMLSSALIGKMRENKAFEGKIFEICRSSNLLNSTDFKESLTKGVRELKEEGWVKLGEVHTIISKYGGI